MLGTQVLAALVMLLWWMQAPMVKALEKRGFRWYSGWDWHHFQK